MKKYKELDSDQLKALFPHVTDINYPEGRKAMMIKKHGYCGSLRTKKKYTNTEDLKNEMINRSKLTEKKW